MFDTRNGFTPSKDNHDFWENGTLPWFKIDDIHSAGIGYGYLDIGIIAEDIDRGYDIWCHASSDYFKHWPEWYPELYEEV